MRGRLELVKEFPDHTKVFIDFAHTPDAIKNAITSLRTHFKKDVTIIFGCGGERDKSKRKKLEKLLTKYVVKYLLQMIIQEEKTRNYKK